MVGKAEKREARAGAFLITLCITLKVESIIYITPTKTVTQFITLMAVTLKGVYPFFIQ